MSNMHLTSEGTLQVTSQFSVTGELLRKDFDLLRY